MYKVLIVDDEPIILESLKNIVAWEEYGFEVFARLRDGNSALNIIRDVEIDFLLTDIKMPIMDGLTLIRNAKELQPNMKCMVLSGYDDFGLVKQALQLGVENYLLKPVNIDELTSTLFTVSEKLSNERKSKPRTDLSVFYENTLYRWLNNDIGFREFAEHANIADIDIRQNEYAVALLELIRSKGDSDTGNLIEAARDICSGIECSILNKIVFSELNGNIVILFSGEDLKAVWGELLQVLEQCLSVINRELKVDAFVTLGGVRSGYKKAHESYSEASSLQDYQLILPANRIISRQLIPEINTDNNTLMHYDSDKFGKLLLQKDYEGAAKYIDSIFELPDKKKGITPENIRNIAIGILYDISRMLKTNSRRGGRKLPDLSFSNVLKIHNMPELREELKQIIKTTFEIVDDQDKNSNALIRQVISYVGENYVNDISIKTLSSTFNINASYLGQLFKSETGELFTNYLNRLRIEKAKEILQYTHLKAHEVSKMVGYTNDNYFTRVFKKLTGVSPLKFRDG